MDMRQFFRNEECPVCKDDLVFSYNYTEVNCINADCSFNNDLSELSYVLSLQDEAIMLYKKWAKEKGLI